MWIFYCFVFRKNILAFFLFRQHFYLCCLEFLFLPENLLFLVFYFLLVGQTKVVVGVGFGLLRLRLGSLKLNSASERAAAAGACWTLFRLNFVLFLFINGREGDQVLALGERDRAREEEEEDGRALKE